MDVQLVVIEQAIEAAEASIARQTEWVLALQLQGRPTKDAERTLIMMLEHLCTLRDYLAQTQSRAMDAVREVVRASSTTTRQ